MSNTSADASAAATITEHEAAEAKRANATGRTPVVFIHGLWLLPSSWDRWAAVFEEAGYTALTPGWPDDPETVAEANAHPEVFANKTVGQVADHYSRSDRTARQEAGRDRAFLRRPAGADRRRPGPCFGVRCDRPGAVPRRAAAAVLGAEVCVAGAREPRESQPRRASHLRAVPLRVRERGHRGRGEGALRDLRGACRRSAALPGCDRELQSVDRGEGRHQEPRTWAAADHLRREGPHRAVGDR